MITQEEIKQFLEGADPEKYIVSVEFDYQSDYIYKIIEDPVKGKIVKRDTFIPFAWVGDLRGLNFYQGSKGLQKEAMSKYGIVIEKLETGGNERLEKGLNFMVKSLKGYRTLIQFFRDGGLDPWGENTKDKILLLPPIEQFLVQKEKRLFKGFESYNDVTRFVFDLETTALEPKDGRIFMFGLKTNKGFHKVIECTNDDEERDGIIEFFKHIDEIKPSIIVSYNGFAFDWFWIFERAKALGLNIKKICHSLNPEHSIRQTKGLLKLANEIEDYTQTSIWGYNVIDALHSVRRAQAINSGIKSAGLKYIVKYLEIEDKDRIYIGHEDIGSMYKKKEEYWLNTENGKYKKVGVDAKVDEICGRRTDIYIKTTGDDLVEKYLDDDLEETLKVDSEFNQGSFLLASLVPTTYQRITTMGTATLWEIQMRAWSYKHGLAIPAKGEKTDFVGGLSRLLKVGYSTDVLKLDFSSLYPSIQLVHDVFPDCDITGAMKGMLNYFRDTRIKYKNLASEYKKKDPVMAANYDRLQLPIKIFINSMFGALSAPQVFHWGDMNQGERITCTGRQYLRQMLKFFQSRGYTPLVCDTDGMNFSLPEGGIEGRKYIGKGNNWLVEKGREYLGFDADVAEYNDMFMKGAMGLDNDGTWKSCINLSRKNYATLEHNGKVKLTGNTIKSKKLPLYIEVFLDKGVKLLLEGEGHKFVEWYYEYLQKIWDKQIPLMQIASRAKVKISIDDYKVRCTQKTKAGSLMSRQAHMELAISDGLNVNLGDVIYYVNNGTRASHGDVQKKNVWSATAEEKKQYQLKNGKAMPADKSEIILNCYRLENEELERNPEMLGDYNVPRAITTFNKRLQPLMVVFNDEVRNSLLIDNPSKREFFTKTQCELISGQPFEPQDQDSVEDLLTITDAELDFWGRVKIDPNYIYELAQDGWEESLELESVGR
jgi:DNA polymerase elongation subunit (family B)